MMKVLIKTKQMLNLKNYLDRSNFLPRIAKFKTSKSDMKVNQNLINNRKKRILRFQDILKMRKTTKSSKLMNNIWKTNTVMA